MHRAQSTWLATALPGTAQGYCPLPGCLSLQSELYSRQKGLCREKQLPKVTAPSALALAQISPAANNNPLHKHLASRCCRNVPQGPDPCQHPTGLPLVPPGAGLCTLPTPACKCWGLNLLRSMNSPIPGVRDAVAAPGRERP